MTNVEPEIMGQSEPPREPKHRSSASAVVEWFWRGARLANARREWPAAGERVKLLVHRARYCADLAQSALTPDEPDNAFTDSIASELYRQSVYWAALALSPSSDAQISAKDDDRLWDGLDEALLARAAPGAERGTRLREALQNGSFVYFAELPPSEASQVYSELRELSRVFSEELDRRTRAFDAIYLQRTSRLLLVFVFAVSIVAAVLWIRDVQRDKNDLARGSAWHASSTYPGGCVSPEQVCPEATGYFFHTQEEVNPWIEFDLGRVQKISQVELKNRTDCCTERANPITIEVSTNNQAWRLVARHDGEFGTWNATFAATEARWVRIRLLNRSNLHLSRVRILP